MRHPDVNIDRKDREKSVWLDKMDKISNFSKAKGQLAVYLFDSILSTTRTISKRRQQVVVVLGREDINHSASGDRNNGGGNSPRPFELRYLLIETSYLIRYVAMFSIKNDVSFFESLFF